MSMIALADFKTAIKKTNTTAEDGFLQQCLDRGEALVHSVVGRRLDRQSWSEYVDGSGDRALFLRNGPIESVTGVYEVTYSSTGAVSTSEYPAGQYWAYGLRSEQWKQPGHLKSESAWTSGLRNWLVNYSTGYSGTAQIPDDLEHGLIHAATFVWNRRVDAATKSRRYGEGGTETFMTYTDLKDDLGMILAEYVTS